VSGAGGCGGCRTRKGGSEEPWGRGVEWVEGRERGGDRGGRDGGGRGQSEEGVSLLVRGGFGGGWGGVGKGREGKEVGGGWERGEWAGGRGGWYWWGEGEGGEVM